jgi:hypothetical protein
MRGHISGRDATYIAIESDSRGPIQIEPPSAEDAASISPMTDESTEFAAGARLMTSDSATPASATPSASASRRAPPRVRKPSRKLDRCEAPTADLEAHRAAMRQAFGDTLSDEFVEVMLGKLIAALRPGPFDSLDEATLNAAIAMISSMNPRNELQAFIAVQIVATGFGALKFQRQSHHLMNEIYIDVYGGYAAKLFRLQVDLIQALDRLQRGGKQTVEVRHVQIHSGAQAVVGILNDHRKPMEERNDTRSNPTGGYCATTGESG